MSNCATCFHFDNEDHEDKSWGICHRACGRFNQPYHDRENSLAWAGYSDDDGEYVTYTHLNVHQSFGCVQWEPKDD